MAMSGNRRARIGQGLRAALGMLLVIAIALVAVDLAEWRYLRVDLSASGRNTLDQSLLDLLDDLPEKVTVDVFFRPLAAPYDQVSLEAQARTLDLLLVARQSRRDSLDLRRHDLSDLPAVRARQQELGVEGTNMVVVTCGGRRTTLHLFGDLARIDWGSPSLEGYRYLAEEGLAAQVDSRAWNPNQPSPAFLATFRAPDALGNALLKVASGQSPVVFFAEGHGEADLFGTEAQDLSLLRSVLERDGFLVETWDAAKDGPVPDSCEILVLVGAAQPYQPSELQWVQDYVEGGGRLVLAPHFDEVEFSLANQPGAPGERSSTRITDLMASYGMLFQPGVVCQRVRNSAGFEVDGDPQCALIMVDERGMQASHPITQPLRQQGGRVVFALTHALRRGNAPRGQLLDLVATPPDAWRDLKPSPTSNLDFRFDAKREERGRASLAMVASIPVDRGATKIGPVLPPAEGAERPEARVLGLASASFLGNGNLEFNQDFARIAFNWLASRDYHMRVAPRDPGLEFIDIQGGRDFVILSWLLWLALPTTTALVGLALWWRRRRPPLAAPRKPPGGAGR